MELLPPKYDVVFHALFREENKKLLSKMISAILKEDIEVKTIDKTRYANIKRASDKFSIMDLRAELKNGEQCNIEIQLNPYKDILKRIIYYSDENYVRQLKRTDAYAVLKKVISILILDYNLKEFSDISKPVTIWQYRESELTHKVLTSDKTIVIIELSKVLELYKEKPTDPLCHWLLFIDNPNSQEVKNIMKNNKDIKEAIFNLKQVSGIKNIQRNIELKEKRRRDEKAALDYATETGLEQGIEQGLQQGIQQGKEEQLKEVVSNMNALGIPMEQIQKITKLSEKEIKKLLEA